MHSLLSLLFIIDFSFPLSSFCVSFFLSSSASSSSVSSSSSSSSSSFLLLLLGGGGGWGMGVGGL